MGNHKMKIAITGAMGVGKTTLAKQIAEAKKGYAILPEVARMMIEQGDKLDKDITPQLELKMLGMQLTLEDVQSNPDWIADRCVVDILAYSMAMFWYDLELLAKIREKLTDRYDMIFYVQPEFPIENDGVRSTDINFQREIDRKIFRILMLSDLKWCKISGTREERLAQVLEVLDKELVKV